MTTREFLVSVSAVCNQYDYDYLAAKASELLASLDARNEKRKSADSKSKRESASRRETVLNSLSETPLFAETIADANGLSVGQVRSALSALVREGKASKMEVKDGKSRKMAYTLPTEA